MDLTEKCLESREIYKGPHSAAAGGYGALPNGKTSLREIVELPAAWGFWPWTRTDASRW